jgi:peptidoglycan/LPS O-acetylase OafA/YrhL
VLTIRAEFDTFDEPRLLPGGSLSAIPKRPEIDGLRAIAVVLVILYHAGLGCPGGYVGVDVFFVISGYLIGALILAEIARGEFRITQFWERRVRRILPALVCVVVACIGFGWYGLVPADFDALGRSVAYQSALLSNVFFYRWTNYFTTGDTHPLLHTWSLALEEQFYLVFPILLALLARFRRRVLVASLGAIAVASLWLSIHGTKTDPTAAFYLLPYRAWELALGALLAAAPHAWPERRSVNEGLGWMGLGLVMFASMTFSGETRFPGASALLPCVGTALVLGSNSRQRTQLGRLLSTRPFVFVGLISYSLYLWHWPLLVLTRYPSVAPLPLWTRLAVVAGSVLLATISWKAVEMPFRNRRVFTSRRRIFTFAGITLTSLLGFGTMVHLKGGLPSRFRPEALRYLEARNDKDFRIELAYEAAVAGKLPEIGRKDPGLPVELLVWGDSHAMALLHVLDALCAEAGVRGLAATHSLTAPLLGFRSLSPFSLREKSILYNQAIVDTVRGRRIKKVLLAASWNAYVCEADFEQALRTTIAALKDASATVFIVEDVPKHPFEVPKALALAAQHGRQLDRVGLSVVEYRAQRAVCDRIFERVAEPSVVILDPAPILIDDNGLCRTEIDGRALYFDRHHLSIHGEMQLRPLFEKVVSRQYSRAQ